MNTLNNKSYLVLMMHKPYHEEDKGFYEQLYAALKDPIVATIYYQSDMPEVELRHMLEDAVGTQKGVVPVLTYFDSGWNEDLSVSLEDLVEAVSVASIVTGNVAMTASYDYEVQGHGDKKKIIYHFSI